MKIRLTLSLLLIGTPWLAAAADLVVYAIDVEGGKSTLFVAPSGESMLVDAGYAGNKGRDADRIVAAARAAGVKQIDYLVITHYHQDHVGGVPQLAAKIPILNFVDHGQNFEEVKDNAGVYGEYVAVRKKAKHIVVKAGDRIPISGMQVDVVTASGVGIAEALPGAGQANPACASYKPLAVDTGENAHSIGIVVTYGRFRMADLGDLYWNQEHDLACPVNKLGKVDVYMSTHHGKKTSGSPQMVWALGPKVAIVNNGATSGAAVEAWKTMHDSPGLLDIWQLHFATGNGAGQNAAEGMIANLAGDSEKCAENWILLTARQDATFTVKNGRTGMAKNYE